MRRAMAAGVVLALCCAAWAEGEKPKTQDEAVKQKLEETKVSFVFAEQPLTEVLDYLGTVGEINVALDDRAVADPNAVVTLKLTNASLGTALELAVKQAALRAGIVEGVVLVSSEEGIKRTREEVAALRRRIEKIKGVKEPDGLAKADGEVVKELEETKASISFIRQPIGEVWEYLGTVGQVNLVADPRKYGKDETLTLKLANVPIALWTTLAADQLGLRCAIGGGVVFISDEKGAARWEAEAGEIAMSAEERKTPAGEGMRKALMEKRVGFAFHDQPIVEAVKYLETAGGVKIVGPGEEYKDKKVTVRLRGVPLGTAIKLVVEQAGLKYEVKDGVVVIEKAEEKAEK